MKGGAVDQVVWRQCHASVTLYQCVQEGLFPMPRESPRNCASLSPLYGTAPSSKGLSVGSRAAGPAFSCRSLHTRPLQRLSMCSCCWGTVSVSDHGDKATPFRNVASNLRGGTPRERRRNPRDDDETETRAHRARDSSVLFTGTEVTTNICCRIRCIKLSVN